MSADQKSAAEMKRHSIRLKYGISENDEQSYSMSKDVEEFENVNAVARPAATKMRTHKMKWKKDEDSTVEVSVRSAEKVEKSSSDLSDETGDDFSETISLSVEPQKVTEIKRRESVTEVRILIIRIEELELANKKLRLQMNRLKKRLRDQNKKIEELTTLNAFLQKSSAAEERKEQKEEEPKPTPQQETIAKRGLEIMKRNSLLEDTVHDGERKTLCNFFEAAEPKPTPEIVVLIDKALSYAMDVILMRPDMFDDVVDNELRLFLLDSTKAKHVLLDVMLLHPEYVPRSWGGDVLVRRKQERMAEAEVKGPRVAEDKTVRDDDMGESKPCKPKPPEVLQAPPQPKLKSPAAKVEPRGKKSKAEKSPGERITQRKRSSLSLPSPAFVRNKLSNNSKKKQATQPAKNAEVVQPRKLPSAPARKSAGQGTR